MAMGKGLDALFGDVGLYAQEGGSVMLPLSQVEAGPNQPRKQFDETGLASLAESIAQHGILQPLTVRRLSSGRYQIIAGERRFRAASIAGLTEVPAIVISADDRKVMEIGLIENLQREDLTPLEEAAGYRALMEEYGLTQEEVAKRVSKSRSAVANTTRLLSLPEEVQALIEIGKLSAGHGRALLSLNTPEQQIEFAAAAVAGEWTVRETEKQVQKLSVQKPAQEKRERSQLYWETERALSADLGRKVTISPGKRKGKITLEYADGKDLDKLLSLLRQCGKEGMP